MRFCHNDVEVPDDRLYQDLQGNILRGFGKLKAAHVFFRFRTRAEAPRAWLREFFHGHLARMPVTSAKAHDEAAREAPLVNLFFTAAGLAHLGHDVAQMDRAFILGSRHPETSDLLDDLPPEQWQDSYRRPWHGMAMLACDNQHRLDDLVEVLRADSRAEIHLEWGLALDQTGHPLKSPEGERHEHFGFRDGSSQPIYLDAHWQAIGDKQYGKGDPDPTIDPRRRLSVVLARDPLAPESCGSYVVYRKLSQDVGGFHRRVAEYAERLERRGPFLAQLWQEKNRGAGYEPFGNAQPTILEIDRFIKRRLLGRDVDGTPWPSWLAPSTIDPTAQNNFNFDRDPSGRTCPFSAHVRKMNPRGTTGDLDQEQRRTLTRRGIPYGSPLQDRSQQDDGSRGLLFLCMQGSIREQFEFVQKNWANARSVDLHAWPTPGGDSLIAQRPRDRESFYTEDRHRKISETIELDFDFYDLVTLRGSEYLFAPSLPGLDVLLTEGRP